MLQMHFRNSIPTPRVPAASDKVANMDVDEEVNEVTTEPEELESSLDFEFSVKACILIGVVVHFSDAVQ